MNISSNVNAMNVFSGNVANNADKMAQTTTANLSEPRVQGESDVAKLLTDDMVNQTAFEAQTKPIQTQDAMYGTLFDMKA